MVSYTRDLIHKLLCQNNLSLPLVKFHLNKFELQINTEPGAISSGY